MNNVQTPPAGNASAKNLAATNRLVFPHRVANLSIRVDGAMAGFYRGEFRGPQPRVTQSNGVISVEYARFNPLIWGRAAADITISPSVRWRLEIREGVSHLVADLREVEVDGIDIQGGVSQADLHLPRPVGIVPIRISGGVSRLTVHRPADVAARVQIGGGASKLALDDQYLGAVGGPVRLESSDYRNVPHRYDLEIGGGASRITVGRD